jgi:hypothetical protein
MVRPPNLISEDSKTFFQTKLEPITACHPAQKNKCPLIFQSFHNKTTTIYKRFSKLPKLKWQEL